MKQLTLLLLTLFSGMLAFSKERTPHTANLESVKVYRTGAEMTHTVRASLGKGNNELVITGLSNQMDINSILIGNDGNVTLMSVEFSTDYLKTGKPSLIIVQLQDSITYISSELSKIDVLLKTDYEILELLKANKEVKGTNTGLDVEELMKLVEYYKTKTLALQQEISNLQERQKKLRASATTFQQQIREEEQKNSKSAGRLELQLLSPVAGTFKFTISYITSNARWSPYYDLKAAGINQPLNVSYKAKVIQTTGIDWKQVKLALATTVPSQQGNAPVFNTWFLTYVEPVRAYNQGRANTIQSMPSAAMQEVVVTGYGTAKVRGAKTVTSSNAPIYIVNGTELSAEEFSAIDVSAIKATEVLSADKATAVYGSKGANGVILVTLKDNLGDYVTVNDNALNVTFDIDIPYDVPSNGKVQYVTLKEYEVATRYKYYAIPKLDQDAYLLGEVADWEKLNLLPGEANIIFEGTYIGKTFIDPNNTADTLNLTLGRDKRIVVKREKMADFSSVKFFGNNKTQVFTYEITVKNNKKEKVSILLKDQYPLSTNKDIEVELLEAGGASVNAPVGVLNWALELAPGEMRKLRFSYSVKYPKDKVVNAN